MHSQSQQYNDALINVFKACVKNYRLDDNIDNFTAVQNFCDLAKLKNWFITEFIEMTKSQTDRGCITSFLSLKSQGRISCWPSDVLFSIRCATFLALCLSRPGYLYVSAVYWAYLFSDCFS